jgi:hypothetical protein
VGGKGIFVFYLYPCYRLELGGAIGIGTTYEQSYNIWAFDRGIGARQESLACTFDI